MLTIGIILAASGAAMALLLACARLGSDTDRED